MKTPVCVTLHLDERKLPAIVFDENAKRLGTKRMREVREQEAFENFGKPGRDPGTFGSVLTVIANSGNWKPHLKIAELNSHWDHFVGANIAMHSKVLSFEDGHMVIRADSPTWTTTLTYMVPTLTEKIREKLDGLELRDIRVVGPVAHGKPGKYVRSRRRGYGNY